MMMRSPIHATPFHTVIPLKSGACVLQAAIGGGGDEKAGGDNPLAGMVS